MDFAELLSVASNNEADAKHQASRISYSTEFTPLKKQPKNNVQSSNIRKFLAKKEQEEKQRAEEAQRKKENLLALRAQNTKSNKKAKLMTSRTKDNDFSKIKLTEDEIEAKQKRERELQALELKNKRERMIARIELEEREKLLPRKRKKKDKQEEQNGEIPEDNETVDDEPEIHDRLQSTSSFNKSDRHSKIDSKQPKKPVKKYAPPVDFHDLLKVASQKQFQPVTIKKVEVEGRPLTKKEKKALEEEQARIQRRIAAEAAAKKGLPYSYKSNGTSHKSKPHTQDTAINNSTKSSSANNSFNKKMHEKNNLPSIKKNSAIQNQMPTNVKGKSKSISSAENFQGMESRKQVPSSSKSHLPTNNYPLKTNSSSSNNIKKSIPNFKSKDNSNFPQNLPRPPQNLPRKAQSSSKKIIPSIKYRDDPNFLERQQTTTTPNVIRKESNDVKLKHGVANKNSISNESSTVSPKHNPSNAGDALSDDLIAKIENRLREKMEKEMEEKLRKIAMQMVNKTSIQSSPPTNRTDISSFKKPPMKLNPSKSTGLNSSGHKILPAKKPVPQPLKSNPSSASKKSLPPKAFHPNPYLLPPRRLLESQRPSKPPPKRRLESDDDDEEDDEDMEDFIDDGDPVDDNEDYSKYIKEIFNYDPSRFNDDEDEDIPESNFAQVCQEEIKSAKVGYLEDKAEEMKLREENRRKALKKKMKMKGK